MVPVLDTIEARKKFVEAWNNTMIDIWQERIHKLHVEDTYNLYRSPIVLGMRADGRFYDITLSQKFLEYGLWQDLGTGREFGQDNGGNLEFLDEGYRREHGLDKPRRVGPEWGGGMTSGNPRERRRWFSTAYYSSTMRLRDFLAKSIGREFVGFFANLDAEDFRSRTSYYRRKSQS